MSYDLLLELKLLLHLVYVSQLLNHLLVLHLIPVVPLFRLATLGRALLVHLRGHEVDLHLEVLLILQESPLLPLRVDASEHSAHTVPAALAVEEPPDCALDLDRGEMLRSHGSTPRLLYDPSLGYPVLPLEIWSQALALVPPMDPGWLPDD